MERDEAVRVAKLWLKHCDERRDISERLLLLARDAKAGRVTPKEVRILRNEISPSPRVFDGARLEKAVRVLIQQK